MSKINEMIRKEIKSWVKGHGWAPYKFSINNKGDLITGRAIFIHHINNEIPSFVEELYNIYLIFEEMIDEYYDWHSKTLPLRYLVWVFIVLLFNIAEFIHFHIQLWYTLPIL